MNGNHPFGTLLTPLRFVRPKLPLTHDMAILEEQFFFELFWLSVPNPEDTCCKVTATSSFNRFMG